ncbi:hypothetical protein QR97_31450 [Streptomyces sp. PBH53]|nr:hypothetical protein QR97_31450 [Streptomyces sp. PBH53]
MARHENWAAAHCQYAAQPTPDRPDGEIIATTAPDRWIGEPVRVLDLTPNTDAALPAGAKAGSAGPDEALPTVADGFGPRRATARRRGLAGAGRKVRDAQGDQAFALPARPCQTTMSRCR